MKSASDVQPHQHSATTVQLLGLEAEALEHGLLLGRALQGVGLGLAPLAIATARDAMPQAKVGPTIALLSVSSSAGLGAGYPISGLMVGAWGLSGAYWFGAVVSALTLVCVALVIPPNRSHYAPGRFDWPGVVLLAAALVAVMAGVSQGSEWGWSCVAGVA